MLRAALRQQLPRAAAALDGMLGNPFEIDPAQVPGRVQRDEVSEAWRQRFLAEAEDPTYLDGGLLFSRLRRGGAFARLFLGARRR
ncbi:MAG TPA: hypothetical protein VGD66_00170 [Allosphingosinicella sp.]